MIRNKKRIAKLEQEVSDLKVTVENLIKFNQETIDKMNSVLLNPFGQEENKAQESLQDKAMDAFNELFEWGDDL